jgi:monofunctional chorismate mutase
MELSTLRQQIDAVDEQLVALFLQRMEIVKNVAQYKIDNNLPVFHADREQAVIEKARSRAPQEMADYVAEFFEAAMTVSRHMQQDLIDQSQHQG